MNTRQRRVTFDITAAREKDRHVLFVHPSLTNIFRAEGGEGIILAIAANCVRTIAKTDGLERALERINDVVVNRTRVRRR